LNTIPPSERARPCNGPGRAISGIGHYSYDLRELLGTSFQSGRKIQAPSWGLDIAVGMCSVGGMLYRGTLLIKNSDPLGPYSRTMPRARYPCRGRRRVSALSTRSPPVYTVKKSQIYCVSNSRGARDFQGSGSRAGSVFDQIWHTNDNQGKISAMASGPSL